jgi:ribosomal 50S subunit-associated protein YjgA (DUF615 family)
VSSPGATRARAVAFHAARSRAERTLAGELCRAEFSELEAQLANLREASHADARELHLAEQWRAGLIEHGVAAASEFPGGGAPELSRLVEAAQRERATGRPQGGHCFVTSCNG